MMSPEKPPIVAEIEKEIEIIKGRLQIVEDALRELWDYYKNQDNTA